LPVITPGTVPSPTISMARDNNSTDTDNNLGDFRFDPTPTPGLQNDAISARIVSLSPPDMLAGAGSLAIEVQVVDVANLNTDANAVTSTFLDGATSACSRVREVDGGRGGFVYSCTAPNRDSAGRGLVTLTSPPLLGVGDARAEFTYTGADNSVDFCVLQFPATATVALGQRTDLIFGRIF